MGFGWAIALDLAYALTLAIPGNWQDAGVRGSVLVTLAVFVVAQALILLRAARRREWPAVTGVFRKNHAFQVLFQLAFMMYWGLYWPPVFSNLALLPIQLIFGYLLESAVCWGRGRPFRASFAIFPIVVSINLFIWFLPEYFYLQLATVALGVVSKMFVRWTRQGRDTHIFNPSALPLSVAALLVFLVSPRVLTSSIELPVSQELGPHVYAVLFFISLLVNIWFPTVLVTGTIFATTIGLHYLFKLVLGAPAHHEVISAPVFLGATLLVTDPATSPVSRPGKVLFGMAYAILVYLIPFGLYALDLIPSAEKVLAVPLVNLGVPWFETFGQRLSVGVLGRLGRARRLLESRAAQLAVWTAFFFAVSPILKEKTVALLHVPLWTVESERLYASEASIRALCQSRQSDICAPYGYWAELKYLATRSRR